MISGNFLSGKTSLARLLARNSESVELLTEAYTVPNRYLPLFSERMFKNGIKYNEFCYGTQLLFMQNRIRREFTCNDPKKLYVIDRSIYEDRHIFAKLFVDLGIMSRGEYDEYRDMFEKIVRNMDPPECFILLNSDPDLCYERMKRRNWPYDQWITRDMIHRMEKLYQERLKERVYLYNPDLKMVEIDTRKYHTMEEVANDAARQLNQVFKGQFGTVSTKDGHKLSTEVDE